MQPVNWFRPNLRAAMTASLTLVGGIAVVLAGASGSALAAGPVHTTAAWTAVPTVAAVSACKSAPSDAHCNNVNPQTSGCAADAYTVTQVPYDIFGLGLGNIELRYSPSCKTNWSRWLVTGLSDPLSYQMYVVRQDGKGAWDTCTAGGCIAWVNDHTVDFWSPMTYAPVQKAQACVLSDDGSGDRWSSCTDFK